MLPLKVKLFFHVPNQHMLMGSWARQSSFEDAWESLCRKLALRVGLVKRLQNQTRKLLKKSYAQQPLALIHSAAECTVTLRGIVTVARRFTPQLIQNSLPCLTSIEFPFCLVCNKNDNSSFSKEISKISKSNILIQILILMRK